MASLLLFDRIAILIPRKKILKSLEDTYITRKEYVYYRRLKNKLEHIKYRIEHVLSVIEKILLRSYEHDV